MTIFSRVKSHQEFIPLGYQPATTHPQLDTQVETFLKETDPSTALALWESFNITPENIGAFEFAIGRERFGRFQDKTIALANQLYLSGNTEKAAGIWRRIVSERIEGRWYKMDESVPLDRAPHGYCTPSRYDTPASLRLFEDLSRFLKNDVLVTTAQTKIEREAREASLWHSCWQNRVEEKFQVSVPEVVMVQEEGQISVPIQVDSNLRIEAVDIFWRVEHPDFLDWPSFDEQSWNWEMKTYVNHYVYETNGHARRQIAFGQQTGLPSHLEEDFTEKDLRERKARHYRYKTELQSFDPVLLFFKANKENNTHEQKEIPILLDFVPRDMPWLKVSKRVLVKVKNENEAPSIAIEKPQRHITEGEEICFKANTEDPEGDVVQREWQLKGENKTLPTRLNDRGEYCVQTPVTGRFEYPIDVEVVAQDVIDANRYPTLKPQSVSSSTRVYIDPLITLPTGEKAKPPTAVVEAMTDPDIRKLETGTLATDSNLFVFLRLPRPLEEFRLEPPSDTIANAVDIRGGLKGTSGSAERRWSPFVKAPSATHVAVAHSPIRRWTLEGNYDLNGNPLFVDHKGRWSYFRVPMKGTFRVEPPKIKTVIHIENKGCEGSLCHYQIRIPNVKDTDGKSYIDGPKELSVGVAARQKTAAGDVQLYRVVKGIRQSKEGDEELLYDLSFSWPEEYIAKEARTLFNLRLKNRYNEEAKIVYETDAVVKDNATAFDKLTFKLDPHLLPDPWFLMQMKGLSHLLGTKASYLSSFMRFDLEICPTEEVKKFVQNCSRLENRSHWNNLRTADELEVGLTPIGYHLLLASTYRSTGAQVDGKISMNLPEGWEATLELPKADMTIPSDPTVQVNWDEIFEQVYEAPEYIMLALFAAKGLFEKNPSSKAQFSTERRTVKPGEKFYIETTLLPKDEKGNMRFSSLATNAQATMEKIHLQLKPNSGERGDVYTLKPLSLTPSAESKYRIEFELPAYLPDGNYTASLSALENIYANYFFTYYPESHRTQAAGTRWEKMIPIVIWEARSPKTLRDLNIVGDPSIQPPSAEGKRVDP